MFAEERPIVTSNTFERLVQTGVTLPPGPPPSESPRTERSARSRCGRKPFGYYTGEQAVIQKMLQMRAHGMGFDRIAEHLNREEVRTRSGKPWHGRVVNRILKMQSARH